MRGKVVMFWKHFLIQGITPAYAGKSYLHMIETYAATDHPRLCGEKVHVI